MFILGIVLLIIAIAYVIHVATNRRSHTYLPYDFKNHGGEDE